jgi:hypothetical protein
MRSFKQFGFALAFGLVSLAATPGEAATIEFTATDLADVVPGSDLWRYEYLVSGKVFDQYEAFTIYFDPARYAELGVPTTTNPSWSLFELQPEIILGTPFDGALVAQALVAGAPTAAPFIIEFVLLGGGTPGSQPFDISSFDADGNFIETTEVGRTRAAGASTAPEPASLLLFGAALSGLAGRRLFRRAR